MLAKASTRSIPKDILPRSVIIAALSQRVNEVLGLTYARPILQLLHDATGPLGFRAIDVEAVGTMGSTKSTNDTLHRLVEVGWVERRDGKYCISSRGEKALAYSIQGDSLETAPRNP